MIKYFQFETYINQYLEYKNDKNENELPKVTVKEDFITRQFKDKWVPIYGLFFQ